MSGSVLVPDFRDCSILVVDDNDFFRKLLITMLRAFRIEAIVQAGDGETAFEEYRNKEFSCVITDWRMSPMDGLALVDKIRRSEESPKQDTPIILCTAYTEFDRILEARDAGVSEILAKPVSAAHLYNKLSTAIFDTRQFVSEGSYVGPDRRRSDQPYNGEERRTAMTQERIDIVMDEGAA